MKEELILKSKKKWFWVSMVISLFLPPVPGFIIGFSLLTEKPYRKEAIIIIIWTIVWTAFMFWLAHYVIGAGLLAPVPMRI